MPAVPPVAGPPASPPWLPLPPVPDVPPYICGAVNLRGQVVPVVDLRVRFGQAASERTNRQVLILIEHDDEKAALLVDRARDAIEIDDAAIEDKAVFGSKRANRSIRGLARRGDGQVDIIVDAPALLASTMNPDL